MRRNLVMSFALLALSGCGDDTSLVDSLGSDEDIVASTPGDLAGVEPCTLLTATDLTDVLGEAPSPEESEPAGPFMGCSWGTGDVLVSVAATGSVVLAPGEDECPPAGLGEESYLCEQRVKFLVDGIHVTVSTIDPFVTNDQLVALAQRVIPRLSS